MKTGKRAIKQAQTLTRCSKALRLRLKGQSLRAISAQLGVSHQQIARDIEKAIEANRAESLDSISHAITSELSRLDFCLERLGPAIDRGCHKGINTAIKISERRCKLLGLDAPIQLRVEALVNKELEQFISALSQRLPHEMFIEVLQVISAIQAEKTAAK